jgi:hypothetical protein
MSPERIIELAMDDEVPKFMFGGDLLAEWTRKHIDLSGPYGDGCHTPSGWYVVIHANVGRPGAFRVLSRWCLGDRVPLSFDVPEQMP